MNNNTIWKKYENCFTVCALISERESQKLYYIVLCICAKHLTVKSYMVINAANSYTYYY